MRWRQFFLVLILLVSWAVGFPVLESSFGGQSVDFTFFAQETQEAAASGECAAATAPCSLRVLLTKRRHGSPSVRTFVLRPLLLWSDASSSRNACPHLTALPLHGATLHRLLQVERC
jgi:hypothetical protein